MEKLVEIKKVLACLSSTDTQLDAAVQRLARLLYESSSDADGHLSQLQEQAIRLSLVKTLLGILGSSDNPHLLSKCAWCLALLVHGNDDARMRVGEMGAVPLLLDLLSPRSVRASEKRWHREWIQVYSQAMVALRKLTYLNQDNQQQFAVMGGIKLITALASDQEILTNFLLFPPEAKTELESLVLNQSLISRVQSVADAQKSAILSRFSAFSCRDSIHSSYYPVFNVTLITPDNTLVSDILQERGVVWPSDTPPDVETRLTRVCVTSVEDGGHCWCQFLSDKQKMISATLSDNLSQMAPPTQDTPPSDFLTLGDVYATYVDCLPDRQPQWIRARLLAMEEGKGNTVTVLAVDYGLTVTVLKGQLTGLPPGCRGIPPQAIPCLVAGVQPPPASSALLENTAAVLRNMAFELLIFRKEILNFEGPETLLKLCQCPHKPTVLQALGALLNMAVSSELREEIGKRGAVRTLLAMCKTNLLDTEVLQEVICCLYNIVLGCHGNISLLLEEGGGRVLASLSKETLSPKVHHCLMKLMQLLPSQRSSGEGVANTTPIAWTARQDSRGDTRLQMRGERRRTNPVCHVLDSDDNSDCEGVICEAGDGLGAPCVISSENRPVSQSRSYAINRQLPVCSEENDTHSFVMVESIDDLSSSVIRRTVCAFINTGRECTVHIGVDRGGVVRGVKVQKKKRDILAVAVDGLLYQFKPSVPHSQYTISFVPVIERGQRCVEDVYVVELTVRESAYHQIYSVQEKSKQGETLTRCYCRIGPFNELLSFQELRDMVARREVDQYKSEVSTLAENIQRLDTAIKTHTY